MLRHTLAALLTLAPAPLLAQGTAPAPAAAPNYAEEASWLCRPGRQDACGAADLTATVVAASGRMTPQRFAAAKKPPVDCFYVYPTVSLDPTPNSDLSAGPEERSVAAQQAARLAETCRVFAPMYRQATITALRAAMTGQPNPSDGEMAYGDVRAAWRSYLARDNAGRGVVIVGHSQGARMLNRLLAEEIEGGAARDRLVGAYLIGFNVMVPAGKDVGGDFKATPLCREAGQTGCVVTYVTFRDEAPPPVGSRFGLAASGMRAGCTNPAALKGGRAPLKAILPARSTAASTSSQPPLPWVKGGAEVTSPFVKVPGLLSGTCTSNATHDYLAVRTEADPTDPRTDAIRGDVVIGNQVLGDWGLHLIDMHVAMGDIVDLIGAQGAAWGKRR
jgi:hypothetical protein